MNLSTATLILAAFLNFNFVHSSPPAKSPDNNFKSSRRATAINSSLLFPQIELEAVPKDHFHNDISSEAEASESSRDTGDFRKSSCRKSHHFSIIYTDFSGFDLVNVNMKEGIFLADWADLIFDRYDLLAFFKSDPKKYKVLLRLKERDVKVLLKCIDDGEILNSNVKQMKKKFKKLTGSELEYVYIAQEIPFILHSFLFAHSLQIITDKSKVISSVDGLTEGAFEGVVFVENDKLKATELAHLHAFINDLKSKTQKSLSACFPEY